MSVHQPTHVAAPEPVAGAGSRTASDPPVDPTRGWSSPCASSPCRWRRVSGCAANGARPGARCRAAAARRVRDRRPGRARQGAGCRGGRWSHRGVVSAGDRLLGRDLGQGRRRPPRPDHRPTAATNPATGPAGSGESATSSLSLLCLRAVRRPRDVHSDPGRHARPRRPPPHRDPRHHRRPAPDRDAAPPAIPDLPATSARPTASARRPAGQRRPVTGDPVPAIITPTTPTVEAGRWWTP